MGKKVLIDARNKLSLFDTEERQRCIEYSENKLCHALFFSFKYYNLESYIQDIQMFGLKNTWLNICNYLLYSGESIDFFNVENLGELYEIGLTIQNKEQKKSNGQYYTPNDVALLMSQWFESLDGENICDVACGTGSLILTYLDFIGCEKARKLIRERRLYLYDIDEIALEICKISILLKYGRDLKQDLHVFVGDFLSKKITLPIHCKVISNPPYSKIQKIGVDWSISRVLEDSHELYSAFMEKIITQSNSAVIITPYSFISGTKFYSLRKVLDNCNGEIFSFDNVPGNIFYGKKHGVFNSNTSNSVRAAISVIRKNNDKGFKLTPLIRFKSTERNKLLSCNQLESFLSAKRQKITSKNTKYYKCYKELQPLFDCLNEQSQGHVMGELLDSQGQFVISMPNTCRYYTTAFAGIMNRNGQIILNFSNKDIFNYVFCLINSSFAYWYWRLYDGGITYPKSLLMQLPVIYHLLSEEDKLFFASIANEMIMNASDFVIIKNNLGIQENIKYPRSYRDKINQRLTKILNIKVPNTYFDLIHSNTALSINI